MGSIPSEWPPNERKNMGQFWLIRELTNEFTIHNFSHQPIPPTFPHWQQTCQGPSWDYPPLPQRLDGQFVVPLSSFAFSAILWKGSTTISKPSRNHVEKSNSWMIRMGSGPWRVNPTLDSTDLWVTVLRHPIQQTSHDVSHLDQWLRDTDSNTDSITKKTFFFSRVAGKITSNHEHHEPWLWVLGCVNMYEHETGCPVVRVPRSFPHWTFSMAHRWAVSWRHQIHAGSWSCGPDPQLR